MNILIVEDETLATKKLQLLIEKLIPDFNTVGIAKSIVDAVNFIKANKVDLGFFDIQIEDGLSFDIFDKVDINFPVIFTTAFNEYAVKAFKLNSIDYLLKPISEIELKNALSKYDEVWSKAEKIIPISVIEEMKQLLIGKYKERFLVKIGNKIEILNTSDICYFHSFEKGTYAKTNENKDSLLDSALDNIYPLLNPKHFFRISRKYIVNIKYIKDVYAYSASRLKVNTHIKIADELIVSREKVRLFKEWLEDN
ncbi:MAG: LytTR family DNA-binding domain-containing protein [Bacteroidota bacterium]